MKKSVIFGVSLILVLVFWIAYAIVCIKFNQDCGGYLKRAADANTIELAEQELNKSIQYLETHDMTSGYTSIIYRTPSEDVGFFYNNLKACQKELSEAKGSVDQMITTNTLMKLRETLTDNNGEGVEITYPAGLERYPNNLLWGIGTLFSLLIVCGSTFYFTFLKN